MQVLWSKPFIAFVFISQSTRYEVWGLPTHVDLSVLQMKDLFHQQPLISFASFLRPTGHFVVLLPKQANNFRKVKSWKQNFDEILMLIETRLCQMMETHGCSQLSGSSWQNVWGSALHRLAALCGEKQAAVALLMLIPSLTNGTVQLHSLNGQKLYVNASIIIVCCLLWCRQQELVKTVK